jgi:hypothetical protein
MRGFTQSLLMIGLLLAMGSTAQAAVTSSDLQIMGRALGFLNKPPSGDVRTGIVVARGNSQSEREGEELLRLLGAGLHIGNVTLKPVLVYITDVAQADVGVFILTNGLGAAAAPLGPVAAQKQIACLTTDIEQVHSGRCVMGVSSKPKIQILVNRAVAAQGKLAFSSVFRMMITEI